MTAADAAVTIGVVAGIVGGHLHGAAELGRAQRLLGLAQQAVDGNFFEQSAVDARLRELRKLQAEEAKQKKNGV